MIAPKFRITDTDTKSEKRKTTIPCINIESDDISASPFWRWGIFSPIALEIIDIYVDGESNASRRARRSSIERQNRSRGNSHFRFPVVVNKDVASVHAASFNNSGAALSGLSHTSSFSFQLRVAP
ncbi:hypothetical protein, partial [Massilia sp. DWR3-1-1]|uniref:hypothetical protein n=1 Tax=Massilia sp. DWR3-1-1 TaxID=2804559 RepID=UPI003CE7DF44